MAGYTGAWRRANTIRSDGTRYTDPPTMLGRPELSAEHMQGEPDTEGSRPPWAVVHAEDVPAWLTDPDADYSTNAAGLILSTEAEGHDAGTSTGGGQTAAAARAQGNAARSRDRGAPREQLFAPVRARAVDEQRETEMYVLEPSSAGSRTAALRGRNSLPENNPDGYRVGQRVRRWQDRKIPGGGLRRHSLHPLRVNTAPAPNVSPAPEPGAANRYASPFSLNISSRVRTQQSPVARRVPRAWDEDVVTDASQDQVAQTPSYVVWGL